MDSAHKCADLSRIFDFPRCSLHKLVDRAEFKLDTKTKLNLLSDTRI